MYAVKWRGVNPCTLLSDSFAPLCISTLPTVHLPHYYPIASLYNKRACSKAILMEWEKMNLRWRVSGPGAWQQRWAGLRPPSHDCSKFSWFPFLSKNQPGPATLGWQRLPPCPQLQGNKPLGTAVGEGIEDRFGSIWKPHQGGKGAAVSDPPPIWAAYWNGTRSPVQLFKDIKHAKGWLLEGTFPSARKYQLVKPMKIVRLKSPVIQMSPVWITTLVNIKKTEENPILKTDDLNKVEQCCTLL